MVARVVAERLAERAAGPRLDLGLQPARGHDQQPADDHRGARRDRRPGVGHHGGVLRARSRPPSTGTPSSSATSCGKIVLVPWPISVDAVSTRIRPSARQLDARDGGELHLARAGEPGAVPGQREADPAARSAGPRRRPVGPAPRRSPAAVAAPARARTRSPRRPARGPPRRRRSSRSTWPVGVVSPSAVDVAPPELERRHPEPLRRSRLSCISAANSVCGAPKPRNAPFGGVLVRDGAGRGSGRSGSDTARPRGSRRATGRPASACVRAAVHHDLDVLRDQPAVARSRRCDAGRSPGGASSSRPMSSWRS